MATRVDSKQLQTAADTAIKKLDEAYAALDKYLDLLTPEERRATLRPPDAFVAAGRTLARAAIEHPVIAQSTEYDPKAVVEDLDNVEIIAAVSEKASRVQQLVADARLAWLAESYVPSLQVYGVAKVIARQNAAVQKLVDPLADVFGTGRELKSKKQKQQ